MSGTFVPEIRLLQGDCVDLLRREPAESINCCVTSPPYFGLRDYGVDGQIGLEGTPDEYVERLVQVFREVRRVIRHDGVLWLNLGDSYARDAGKGQHKPGDSGKEAYVYDRGGGRASATIDLEGCGLKPKDLIGIPWMVAFALRRDGWYLRSDVIWSKPNAMPESVEDRPTKAHEYLFLLSKSERYWYGADAIKEPAGPFHAVGNGSRTDNDRDPDHGTRKQDAIANGTYAGFSERWRGRTVADRNARSVWTIATKPYAEAHFATFPEELVSRCVLSGCPDGGTVLDPFAGSGTTLAVAARLNRHAVGCELNPEYVRLARKRVLPDAQPRLAF